MENRYARRRFRSAARRRLIYGAAFATLTTFLGGAVFAQSGRSYSSLPATSITSDDPAPSTDAEAPPAAMPEQPAVPARRAHAPLHTTASDAAYVSVEPAHAMVKLKQDAWAYTQPDTDSHAIERVHSGKLLAVTGSTRYYVQVKLKEGVIAYVPMSAVDLTHPEDKLMRLSANAAVVSLPNRYGHKLTEVHQGHDIHVIGVALNYVKIRMKSGMEGFVPMTSTE